MADVVNAQYVFAPKGAAVLRHSHEIEASSQLKHVRYEIRGMLARRALELELQRLASVVRLAQSKDLLSGPGVA